MRIEQTITLERMVFLDIADNSANFKRTMHTTNQLASIQMIKLIVVDLTSDLVMLLQCRNSALIVCYRMYYIVMLEYLAVNVVYCYVTVPSLL